MSNSHLIRDFPFASRTTFKSPGSFTSTTTENIPLTFTPLTIKSITFKNRIGVAPMCMYSSMDGIMNAFHLIHLGQYALRGAGLVTVEATSVSPNGRISVNCAGIWNDDQAEAMIPVVNFIKSQGAVAAIQLAHAGRKAGMYSFFSDEKPVEGLIAPKSVGGWPDNIDGPSAIQGYDYLGSPNEMSIDKIRKVIEDFGQGARRAQLAGYDVIELHGAHGYLIHEFLSPISNQRTDEYAGSFENRIRFLIEIIDKVREYWPADKLIFVRLSATDHLQHVFPDHSIENPCFWDMDEVVKLGKILVEKGIDVISISSGGSHQSQKILFYESYHVPFAERLKKEVENMKVSVAGLITTAQQAESILKEGKADFVLFGREFLRNPNFALDAMVGLGGDVRDVDWPLEYERGRIFKKV